MMPLLAFAYLQAEPVAFSLFSRSGATCQAVGFPHASYEETRVFFRASFSDFF